MKSPTLNVSYPGGWNAGFITLVYAICRHRVHTHNHVLNEDRYINTSYSHTPSLIKDVTIHKPSDTYTHARICFNADIYITFQHDIQLKVHALISPPLWLTSFSVGNTLRCLYNPWLHNDSCSMPCKECQVPGQRPF